MALAVQEMLSEARKIWGRRRRRVEKMIWRR
jgi:hypothetical protein